MKTQSILDQSIRIHAYCDMIHTNQKRLRQYYTDIRVFADFGISDHYREKAKRSERLDVYLQIRLTKAIKELNSLL
jgi:hypothetical protein